MVLLVIVVVLLGRGSSEPQRATLSVWSPFDEAAAYQEISADFLQKNPSVSLEFKHIVARDAKDYEAKVINAIADGEGPDIWLARFDWLPKHLAKSQPMPASGAGIDPAAELGEVITSSVIELNTHNGQLYGLPLAADTLAIIYNRDLYRQVRNQLDSEGASALERPPADWEELKAQSALVSRREGTNLSRSAIALGSAENTFAAVDVLSAFLVQSGVRIVGDDLQSVLFNLSGVDPANQERFPAVEALDYYTSFARSASAHYSWNTGSGGPIEAFLAGRTGALIGYHSTLAQIIEKKPAFELAVAALPQRQSDQSRVDFAAGWTHLVNRDSLNQALAWRYLRSLASAKLIDRYASLTGRLAPLKRSGVRVSGGLYQAGEAADLFAAQLATAKNLFKPEWQTVDETFQDMIKQVVNSGVSPATAVDSAALRLKQLIKPAA